MRRQSSGVGIEAGIAAAPAIPLDSSQVDELASVLSRVYNVEPHFKYMLPDERARLRLLHGLFRVAIRASQLHGEIYTTQALDGGAVWIGPGSEMTLVNMMRTELPAIPDPWGWANLRRCIDVGLHLDQVHQRLVHGPHWYLMALGAEASEQRVKVSDILIEPLLSRADSVRRPCYLETFNERNLPFYERHGFRIAGGGKIARGGPDFWAMIRAPQTF